jgi:arginyl-tRNA synthetase
LDITAEANKKAQGNHNDEPVLGAIKYAFLKFRIGADSVFEPTESVNLHGNSGPYLQYALVRARSIIRRQSLENTEFVVLTDGYSQQERALLFKFTEYPHVITQATIEFMPHHLCTYLYELAQIFNRFYEKNRIVGDNREQIRIQLVKAYITILGNGLTILGIPTPDKM